MSWQRPASAAPERGPYAPPPQPPLAQPYGNQQNMYPNYHGAPPAGNAHQQYWQSQQQPQYNQQYGQVYQQQDYGSNANQLYQQQTQYNQNYSNQGYANSQQGVHQNYYPTHGVQAGYQGKANADSWEDNWDWGWEETAKQAQNATSQNPVPIQPAPQPQQQAFNNANVIEESFASTDTWDWSTGDKKVTKEPAQVPKSEPAQLPVETASLENNSGNEPPSQKSANNIPTHAPSEEVRSLNDRDVVKERLPNLALGKRFHLDNLTPQWSIESQMSQESSDGPHTHSEGTYRSENQSRNSSKSSPGLNTDNSNFNYSQSALDEYPVSSEWSKHSNEEPTLVDNEQSNSRRESHNDLANSMQEMSIANKENPAPDSSKVSKESDARNVQDNVPANALHSSVSQPNFPPPASSVLAPSLSAVSASMPPAPPVTTSGLPPPPTSSVMMPPPTNFPPTSSNTNPFKQSAPFSHKKVPSASPSLQSFPASMSSTNLTSPAAVSKVSQHRMPLGFGANLETTPDNSERPDQPQMSAFRPMPVAQQVPDNLEVAPQNDRNEYLQTAHLSSADYGENTDFSRGVPPPGLRRMVVGQQETEYSQPLNISGDEPPPGLARMVPGQQNEVENSYNQPNDNYMDRHIDGQPTEGTGRPYRQADGQQTPDNYSQAPPTRGQERRPIGLDRMVPGEPSNDEYSQYQGPNYGSANEQRVVMGVDHDYPLPTDAGPSDIREQNVDGSDYSEQTPRNAPRNVIGAREVSNDSTSDYNPPVDEQQREIIMEGENLQDLSVISSGDLTFSREQTLDGADVTVTDMTVDRKTDLSDSLDHPVTSSRRQSATRLNSSGEESDHERSYKSSPRKDRDKHKPSRDRDRDRERDKEGRYSRGDRKYDRESDRRSTRDDKRVDKDRRDRDRDRRDRDLSPESRRHRRSTRSHRYETEDTDYYSDRERERRRYREGSYASKPPRPDKDRRHDERDRLRRYNTIERDRRYEGERRDERRDERRSERRERHEGRYRDIDPRRKLGNLHKEREDEERRRGSAGSSPSRVGSAGGTDDDGEARRRSRRSRPPRDRADPYYDGYGGGVYGDPYALQVQQYQYYEHLRRTDPAAYMQVYQQLMAGTTRSHHHKGHPYAEGYTSLGYEARGEGGSVHSGRSSTTGLKGNDTYFVSGAGGRLDGGSLRDVPSLRTDLSDRELNTDASLNLQLEESTVRSERMTPFKFSTAHCKGSISSRHVVLVRGAYPVDGRPPTVHVVSLQAATAADPHARELAAYPGPLVKGVTHKKSVIEYCNARAREAHRAAPRDPVGYALMWEFLALLLRQNGVVVGADIAELLMKNAREQRLGDRAGGSVHSGSRAGSSAEGEPRGSSPDQPSASGDLSAREEAAPQAAPPSSVGDQAALDTLRDYLIYGNRQEALEWAMSSGQWAHALALSAFADRRARAQVLARFLAAVPRRDPLHTLYAHLHGQLPPAATHAAEERWADWRPHLAMMLANASSRPDHDRRALTQLGDSLSSRGLVYSAQFCYVSCGLPVERHPLAPLQPGAPPPSAPRLPLLLWEPRAASLAQLATNQAVFATEIYEYALSLNQDYVINELQVYKLILASRLVDCGQYERALAYVEQAARAVTRQPQLYAPKLLRQLADLAERLKYHDPALQEPPLEEAGEEEASPRHQQWLLDVQRAAQLQQTAGDSAPASQQETPLHQYAQQQQQQQYSWNDQPQQQYQQQYAEPEESPDYSQYYQQPAPPQQAEPPPAEQYAGYEDWGRTEEQHSQAYADPYWQPDSGYGYNEAGAGGEGAGGGAPEGEEPRPTITMPGARPQPPPYADYDDGRPPSADQTERDGDSSNSPKAGSKKPEKKEEGAEGRGKSSGWLGGILTKLSLRPPNQMILPDDKNPSIVWDPEKKRWRNVDGDEDEGSRPPPPPPVAPPAAMQASPLMQSASPPLAGAPPVSNIFKMQKGRHIKKSYVDVFNPSGAATRPLPPPSEVLGPTPSAGPTPTFFVPNASHSQPVTLSMPDSSSASPADSPQPSPRPSPSESGVYDPTQAEMADDYRSGI